MKSVMSKKHSKLGRDPWRLIPPPAQQFWKKHETPFLVVRDSKKLSKYKQPNAVIDYPFLATIYAQISHREG